MIIDIESSILLNIISISTNVNGAIYIFHFDDIPHLNHQWAIASLNVLLLIYIKFIFIYIAQVNLSMVSTDAEYAHCINRSQISGL